MSARRVSLTTALKRGRKRVEEGWCQGSYHRGSTGEVCAMGGLRVGAFESAYITHKQAEFEDEVLRPILKEAINEGARKKVGGDFAGVEDWNDHGPRRKAQVLAAFDRAIALASTRPKVWLPQ